AVGRGCLGRAVGRGCPGRFGAGPGPGPGSRFRRTPAPIARAPDRAGADLLPRGDPGDSCPRARHTARYGQITTPLRAACAAPAAARPRCDRVLMNSRLPKDIAAADADSGTTSPALGIRPGRRLIAVLLLAAAALDLIRCSLVPMAATHAAPAAGLIAAGLAAATLSVRTARGCQADRRWSSWAALLIGATSAPQAAVAGFHSPYTIPDTATAALGVLLTVAVLATAGRTEQPGHHTDNPCFITGSHPMSHLA